MKFKIFAHLPFHVFYKYSEMLTNSGYGPEIYFNSRTIYSDEREIERVLNFLRDNSISCTMHAPYLDLSPGAIEDSVRKIALERFLRTVSVANILKPVSIVFHPNWDHWKYEDDAEEWLKNSRDTFSQVLESLHPQIFLVFENVYDQNPEILLKLRKDLNPERVGFCFDTGHFLNFSTIRLEEWLDKIKNYLIEIHLHDNMGERDEHLAIGDGIFPFHDLFLYLKENSLSPLLTIEAHSFENFIKSERRLREILKNVYGLPMKN